MSVGFLKRALALVNLAAALSLCGAAYGFVSFRAEMDEPWQPPGFTVPVAPRSFESARCDQALIPLGRAPGPRPPPSRDRGAPNEPPEEPALDRLGDIRDAIVARPPYGDVVPAIVFRFKRAAYGYEAGDVVVVRIGEALVTRPHRNPQLRAWGDREPVRYRLVGCEPDPKRAGGTLFVFDVSCDGERFSRARWNGGLAPTGLPEADAPDSPPQGTRILRPPGWQPQVQMERVRAPRVREPSAPFVRKEGGTLVVTEVGVAYLRENHGTLLKEVHTAPHLGRDGVRAGVRIRRIREDSVADRFGLMEGDVIVRVNRTPVHSKAEAIKVVKRDLERKVRCFEVEVLRLGASKVLRYDVEKLH